jgi:UDP-N-acetylglucosamine 2-epimerase
MTKILSVVVARPQFVKAAAVTPALRAAGLREILVHTGQHYDWAMSAAFFEGLGLPEPDHNLQVGSASHGAQTGRMLEALEQVMQQEQPALVVIYGDTNSTLAGADAGDIIAKTLAARWPQSGLPDGLYGDGRTSDAIAASIVDFLHSLAPGHLPESVMSGARA